MADGNLTGRTEIVVGGRVRALVFTMRALDQLHTVYGDHASVAETLRTAGPATLVDVAVIGLRGDWPEVTADALLDDRDVAFVGLKVAVHAALARAYYGDVVAPEGDGDHPPTAATLRQRIAAMLPGSRRRS